MKKFTEYLSKYRNACAIISIVAIFDSYQMLAQPYFTNSSPQAGAYQYNQAYPLPYQPSLVVSNQYRDGICYGTIVPGNSLSNSFPAGITYSTAPTLTVSSSVPGTNSVVSVTSLTTTNFILLANTNLNTIYWQAIGH
jgi:hypothetical protein